MFQKLSETYLTNSSINLQQQWLVRPHTNRANKTYGLILQLLLTISGNVETNPGPRKLKFPCGECKKAVKNSENAIYIL